MGSVIANWSGRCPADSDRQTFLSFNRILAEENERYWADHPSPITTVNQMLHDMRSEGQLQLPRVREYAHEISGPIIVRCDVLGAPSTSTDATPVIDELHASGLAVSLEGGSLDQGLVTLPQARLEGIDFCLFDPRGLYPGEDRISFVFLHAPEHPPLDKVLVRVHETEACRRSSHPAIKAASWYLEAPSIHLRYAHEQFLDIYMSWVRFFFMPDLYYWRYEAFPGDKHLSETYSELVHENGRVRTRDLVFEYNMKLFLEEADRWIAAARSDFRQ